MTSTDSELEICISMPAQKHTFNKFFNTCKPRAGSGSKARNMDMLNISASRQLQNFVHGPLECGQSTSGVQLTITPQYAQNRP
jgi:hypothetical protein